MTNASSILAGLIGLTLCGACASTPSKSTTANPAVAELDHAMVAGDLAARRAQVIRWLDDYYDAGQFPTDATGKVISVFRDTRGVRCPMAELIHRSGHDELVDAVVAQANDLRLADVHDGPLYDWMLQSGLTRDEIVMVQGAAMIDYSGIQFDIQPQIQPRPQPKPREQPSHDIIVATAARAEVRGHLKTALQAIRANTQNALKVIAVHYHDAPSPGPIVPPSARRTARR